MRAVRVERFGGPEVLDVVDLPDPVPGPGRDLLTIERAGINFADSLQAEDAYLAPTELPLVPGVEAVGTLPDGRRVVALLPGGGYAERAAAPTATTFDVPDGVDDGAALATVLQGTTAWHVLRTSGHLAAGETVVVTAAAGGVGTLAVQLGRLMGAGRVVALASTEAKRALATDLGADVTVDPAEEDLTAAVRDACGGRADLVLEMTGGPTTTALLHTLAPFGRLVVYGAASQQALPPVGTDVLLGRSWSVGGFWLAHTFRDPARLLAPQVAELMGHLAAGRLRAVVGGTYALSDVRRAHEDLRARRTVGKLLLDPSR